MTTVGALIDKAKIRADMERSKFVSPAAWLNFYNDAYSELYDLLIGSYQEYFLKPELLTVSGGTGSVSLPADFYKLKGVDSVTHDDSLDPFDFDDRLSASGKLSYSLSATALTFLPKALANGSYTLWYVPTPAIATATSDTVLGAMGWEEFIVLGMATKALSKEESIEAYSVLKGEKDQMQMRIVGLAPNRNANKRRVIRDVR